MCNMALLQMTDGLCQFIQCCRWMSATTPNFHETLNPLNEILEQAYMKARRRRRTALKTHLIAQIVFGSGTRTKVLKNFRLLHIAVKLLQPKEKHVICVFTDTSDK